MNSPHTAIIDQQLQAYNQKDLEKFISFYSPDAEIRDLTTGKQILKGTAELRERYSKRFASPNLRAQISNRIIKDNLVIDHEKIQGIVEGEIFEGIVIYEIKDNLIIRTWTA